MENDAESKGERIAKVMARAGLCSRRDAEKWIEAGRVSVNGNILTSPALAVLPTDVIEVDGQKLKAAEKTRLFLFHKPDGLVTTNKDEKGRKTIYDALPKEMGRVVSVGRLDLNTEGLLLLTNDGELSRYLELPVNAMVRKYRVRVHGHVSLDQLARLKKGIKWQGVAYGPMEARLEKTQGTNSWIEISLTEGKNREVRNVMESMGLEVSRLIRLSYGPFQLGSLPRGAVLEIKHQQLRDQIKGYFKK